MERASVFGLVLVLFCCPSSFSQQTQMAYPPVGTFARAINAKQLIAIGDIDPSMARQLTKAVCPTAAATFLSVAVKENSPDGNSQPVFETDGEVLPGNYCLLSEAQHAPSFMWGPLKDESRVLVKEKRCLQEISTAAEDLTGRKPATCFMLGGYGTGRIELVDYARGSQEPPLAGLMIISDSIVDGTHTYSLAKFSAGNPIWASELDGNFHPERFRYLFTISTSHDPNNEIWFTALEWDGPKGTDLVLFQPVGNALKPILVNHDRAIHRIQDPEIALR